MDDRLTELEIRYMRQERTIDALSETVYRLGSEIDRLLRDVEALRDQLSETNRGGVADPGEEPPPPHY